jgi:hypothetical protein
LAGGLRGVARLRRVATGAVRLHGSDRAGYEGEDEEYGGAAEHDPEPTDQPGLRTRSLGRAALLGVGEVRSGVEELLFGRGQVGMRLFLPLQGLG